MSTRQIPMRCANCPGYYMGTPGKDEDQLCKSCTKEELQTQQDEWVRTTNGYLNEPGKERDRL